MTDRKPLAVYRLLPGFEDGFLRARFPDDAIPDDSLSALIRWQINGSPPEHPTDFTAEWIGEKGWRAAEFPAGYHGAPVLGPRIAGLLRNELLSAGKLLPMRIVGPGPRDYFLFLVTEVIDCVDMARSSPPKQPTGELQHAVFRPDALPVGLPAFRLPQFPTAVYWNGWAVDRLTTLLGDEPLDARLCWSEDPAATPHPNPWGL